MIVPPADRSYDLLAMGRSSLDLYAEEIGAQMTEVHHFSAYVGGCPTNVCVGARRLGLRTVVLTAVGDDQVGDFVLRFLEREGIETRFVSRKSGHRTSAVVLTIQPPDHFPMTFYRDNCADRALTVQDVDDAPIADSRVVFVTGTGLSHQPSRDATVRAADHARRAGALVALDLDYRPDQWESPAAFASTIRALLSRAHVAIGTEEETVAAAAAADLETAIATLRAAGPETLVIKRGPRGATVIDADRRIDVPAFVVDVLNVLGAGDAFASGFLYGCLQGAPPERAARIGNASGALIVTRHGCANFMPTLAEIETFVGTQGGWSWADTRA